MDPNGGLHRDLTEEQFEDMKDLFEKEVTPVSEEQYETLKPMKKSERKGYMRNQPCICGSGIKFKKCCWNKHF